MFSVFFYVIVILIALLVIFLVRQVRLQRMIAQRRAMREQETVEKQRKEGRDA